MTYPIRKNSLGDRFRVSHDPSGSISCVEQLLGDSGIRFSLSFDGETHFGLSFNGRIYDLSCDVRSDTEQKRVLIFSSGACDVPDEVVDFVVDNVELIYAMSDMWHSTTGLVDALSDQSDVKGRVDAIERRVNPTRRQVAKEREIAARLRWQILQRDGHRCRYCGCTPDKGALRVDHVVPVSKGGKSTPENLVTACHECNAGKSDLMPEFN